jgi:hypothetical protein
MGKPPAEGVVFRGMLSSGVKRKPELQRELYGQPIAARDRRFLLHIAMD